MVGRHVNAAPGETCASERPEPGGHHLLSRQRWGAVSTPERRRQETRERKALQGIGRSEPAAFSERLDFRAAREGQAEVSLAGQRAGATAAGAGGAGKTVDAGLDLAPLQIFRRDVPQVNPGLVGPSELQVEHLIEVAIIKLASVADAERGAAHQA